MSHLIQFADESLKNEIDHLRMSEYAQASGYSVDLETLRWKVSDNESFVMIARDDDQIISTMRGEVINDQGVLEKKLECPWDFDTPLQFPVLLLSRAATAKSHQALGLNLILRYWFLKMAQLYAIPMVIGTFVQGSPRQNTLLKMGYRFFENKLGWQQSTYRSLRPVVVALLDMKMNGEQALRYVDDKMSTQSFNYVLDGNFPELKYVRNL